MIITKITIYKCNRLSLLGRDKVTLYPNKNMTILIGVGGVGKSTILSELSPLPADLKEYATDGYKSIFIKHHTHTYLLESLGTTNKHNFIVDNVNLNKSGTRKQQLILVKEHFNITPHLIEVLLGINTFTNMSINERKRWFLESSNIDYTYPLQVYSKLKNRATELKSNIKLLNSKLANEKANMLDGKQINKLNKDLSMCYKHIEELLTLKNNTQVISIPSNNLDNLLSLMDIYVNKLSKSYTLDTIDIEISKIETNLITFKQNLVVLKKDMQEIIQVENVIKDGDLNTLQGKFNRVDLHISKIKDDMYMDISFKDLETTQILLKEIYPTLGTYLEQLTLKTIDNETYIKYKDEVTNINLIKNRYIKERDKLVNMDNRLTDDEKHIITCTNCKSEIHVNYNKKEHERVKSKLKKLITELGRFDNRYKEITEDIDVYLTNKQLIDNVHKLSKQPYIDIPLKYIFNKHNILSYSGNIMDTLFKVTNDIQEWSVINNLIKDKESLNNNINILKNNLDVNIKNKDIIKDKIIDVTNNINRYKNILDILNKDRDILNKLKNVYDTYNRQIKDKDKVHHSKLQVLKNEYINKQVSVIKEYITEVELKLNDAKYIDINIKKLQDEISKYYTRLNSVNKLINTLSPTDGLIAKSLNTTLNRFIYEINKFISKIWSYDLKVLPCSIDKYGLTYRFPVTVNNDIPRKDVNKCSSSQQEIINLGFKLTLMKYMGMVEYPLYLDEFGRSFDITHLEEAYRAIDVLIENDELSQIFMISHFQHVYNRFPHATLITLQNED